MEKETNVKGRRTASPRAVIPPLVHTAAPLPPPPPRTDVTFARAVGTKIAG